MFVDKLLVFLSTVEFISAQNPDATVDLHLNAGGGYDVLKYVFDKADPDREHKLHEWLPKITAYGCWCSRLAEEGVEDVHLMGVQVHDELDRLCRDWHRGRRCAKEGDFCSHDEHKNDAEFQMLIDLIRKDETITASYHINEADCSQSHADMTDLQNSCIEDVCTVDVGFAIRIKDLMMSGLYTDAILDSSVCVFKERYTSASGCETFKMPHFTANNFTNVNGDTLAGLLARQVMQAMKAAG